MSIRYRNKENFKTPELDGYKTFKIEGADIDELKFNPYNDRFAMESNQYKYNNEKELGFDPESQEFIFQELLLKSNSGKNLNTRNDILKKGVLRDIYVDDNGVILDGNRRIAILKTIIKDADKLKLSDNRLKEFKEPKLILIQKELNESEIRDTETILQISEDEKVTYDPINMYLKINRLFHERKEKDISKKDSHIYDEIVRLLGPKHKKDSVQKSHATFKVMEDYLKFFNKWGQYTFLQHKEDHFKQISSFLKSAKEDKIDFLKLSNDIDKEKRVSDIKKVLFDLTSAHVEGKLFRELVPKSQKVKSILIFTEGLKKMQNYILRYLKKDNETIHSNTSNSEIDKAVKSINDQFSTYIKTNNHFAATKDIIKGLKNKINTLEEWHSKISVPYDKNKKVEADIYICVNKLKRIVKDYGNNGQT